MNRCIPAWLVALIVAVTGAPAFGRSVGATSNWRELLVQIVLNGRGDERIWPVLRMADGRFYAPADFFTAARLRLPSGFPARTPGGTYFCLNDMPGAQCTFDPSQQVLRITAPAEAFQNTVLNGMERATEPVQAPGSGAFLNHEFQVSGGQEASTRVSGLLEGGLFSRWGILTSRFVAHDLVSSRHATRLDTQLVHDFPTRRESLTVGDSISQSAPWARQVYYGGVRFGSKFSTQPEFISQALPSMSGMAVKPSVIDIYADNVHRMSTSVPQGPFAVNNVPVLSGQGTITMVVTDILGNQQVTSQPYSSSALLLRKGVQDFTYEGGAIRNNFGLSSSSYRGWFSEGSIRRGITDSITINGRAEIHPRGETAGFGADFRLGPMILGGGGAGSVSQGRTGTLAYADVSHSGRTFGASAHYQLATATFTQLGLARQEKPEVRLLQAMGSRSLSRRITLAGGYLQRDGRSTSDVRAVSASLSVGLGRGVLMMAVNRSLLKDRSLLCSVTMVLPIGRRRSISSSTVREGNRTTSTVEMSKQPGQESGIGYRVRGSNGANRVQAEISHQNDEGLSQFGVDNTGGQNAWRASHNGGLVFMGGHLLPSRWLNDSFAVVEMPNGDGIGVSANNQQITKLHGKGVALIPWLAAYEPNPIDVDGDALPMDMSVEQTRQTVVPMPRSGVLVRFVPQRSKGAVVRMITADGQPVPTGASVSVDSQANTFPVALHGEVYIPTLRFPSELTVQWEGHSCVVKVANDASSVLPRIGPLVCKPVANGVAK